MLCSTMLPAGDPLTIEISSFRPVPTRLNKNIRPTLTRKKRRKFMAESLRFVSGQNGVCAVRIISHATGIAKLVPPCALAGAAAGADGLIIEVHNDPIHALCDGAQSLRPEEYAALAGKVKKLREAIV